MGQEFKRDRESKLGGHLISMRTTLIHLVEKIIALVLKNQALVHLTNMVKEAIAQIKKVSIHLLKTRRQSISILAHLFLTIKREALIRIASTFRWNSIRSWKSKSRSRSLPRKKERSTSVPMIPFLVFSLKIYNISKRFLKLPERKPRRNKKLLERL